ncbi:hypothetical protein C8R44DRAFT_750479 [Mycena epipterygia]|nr:hypothetical protein C8R44DRAFT_750479 [Mycena epipterygia]
MPMDAAVPQGRYWRRGLREGKRRSERVCGRTVAPPPLGGLPGGRMSSYSKSSVFWPASWRVSNSVVLGIVHSASRMRCRSRGRVSLPRSRKRRPPLEEDVDVDAAEDAADGGRSTDRDFERSRWAGICRKRGSLHAGIAETVGEDGAGVGRTHDVGFGAGARRNRYGGKVYGGGDGWADDGYGGCALCAVPRLLRAH